MNTRASRRRPASPRPAPLAEAAEGVLDEVLRRAAENAPDPRVRQWCGRLLAGGEHADAGGIDLSNPTDAVAVAAALER